MKKKLIIGPRIKRLRSQLGLTQAEFARRLDVSATYVNLIERNQRPVSAAVLLKLAEEFQINVADLAQDMDAGLVNELVSALRDPVFGGAQIPKGELEDLVGASPETIKAFLRLHERYRELAATQQQLSRHELAVELLDEALKLAPNHPEIRRRRAESRAALGLDSDTQPPSESLKDRACD